MKSYNVRLVGGVVFIILAFVGLVFSGGTGSEPREGSLGGGFRPNMELQIQVLRTESLMIYTIPRYRLTEEVLAGFNGFVSEGWDIEFEWDTETDVFIFFLVNTLLLHSNTSFKMPQITVS